MRIKRFTNILHLIIAIVLSYVLTYVFLALGLNIKSSYLFSDAIAILLYIILTLIYKKGIQKQQCIQCNLKKYKYSFLNNCNLTNEFVLKGNLKISEYYFNKKGKEDLTEKLYKANNNKLIREKDITLFQKKGLIIFTLIIIIFGVLGYIFHLNGYNDLDVVEAFGIVFTFKFMNLFPIFGLMLLISIIKLAKIKCTPVDGKVISVFYIKKSYPTNIGGLNTVRNSIGGRPKYEYIWNGEKKQFVSNSISSFIPKVGSTKKLYVDNNGKVVREKGDFAFMIFTLALIFIFYLIGVFGIFDGI